MLDPETMVTEQIIDKYISVVIGIFDSAPEIDDDMRELISQMKGVLQIGKATFLMVEAVERVAKQYGLNTPQFPWSDPDRGGE